MRIRIQERDRQEAEVLTKARLRIYIEINMLLSLSYHRLFHILTTQLSPDDRLTEYMSIVCFQP